MSAALTLRHAADSGSLPRGGGGPGEGIEAKNLPVAPHHFPELMTPLLGASPNALAIEYLPYFVDGMFEQAPVIDRGMIRPPDVPGHGIRFHPDVLKTAQ